MNKPSENFLGSSKYHIPGTEAINYLVNQLHPDGRFSYIYYPKTGEVSYIHYNLLRHAGTLYSMYLWHNLHQKKFNGERPLKFIKSFLQSPLDMGHMSCVTEKETAKLGGSALLLLALTEKNKCKAERGDFSTMRKLAEYLIWMQDPSGKFRSKSNFKEKQFDPFESLYYPGEAILALIRLYNLDPDPRWLSSAKLGADYLVKHPVMQGGVRKHNHWFAIALTELYLINPKEAYYTEYWNITDIIIAYVPKHMQTGYTTAGMATLGEAIVAGILMEINLGKHEKLEHLFSVVDNILDYILRLQIQENDPTYKNAVGGIMSKSEVPEIRIDFVQHTLQVICGTIMARKIMEQRLTAPA